MFELLITTLFLYLSLFIPIFVLVILSLMMIGTLCYILKLRKEREDYYD